MAVHALCTQQDRFRPLGGGAPTPISIFSPRSASTDLPLALYCSLAAVAAAYGWPADISEDDALARLFALNQSRALANDLAALRL